MNQKGRRLRGHAERGDDVGGLVNFTVGKKSFWPLKITRRKEEQGGRSGPVNHIEHKLIADF